MTDRTKVIFLSHITSPTALTFPVADICRRARERNILTVIDGAHAPGQVDVHLGQLSPDFYFATCHKWMCAPKGSAFLFAREDRQHLVEPLVIGWGWGDDRTFRLGHDFLDNHEWLGTHDPSGYLTVPFAIEFLLGHDLPAIQQRSRELIQMGLQRASQLRGASRVHPDGLFQQMGLVEIPADLDERKFKALLYERHRIEVPVIRWQDRLFIRISAHAYTTEADVDAFVAAIRTELP